MIIHPYGLIKTLLHNPTNATTLIWISGLGLSFAFLLSIYLQKRSSINRTAATDPSVYFKELYGIELEVEEEIEIPDSAVLTVSKSPDRVQTFLPITALAVCLLLLCGFETGKNVAVQRLWLNAETVGATGNQPQAEKYYRQALRLDPWCPQSHLLVGKCLVSQHKLKDAVPHLTLAMRALAGGPDTALQLGACEMRIGNLQVAETAYRKAVAMAPNAPEPRIRLGQCLAAQGHLTDARHLLEYALSLDGNNAGAHSTLGLVLLAQGDNEASVSHLKRGVELAPANLTTRNNLGTAYAVAGNYREAIDQFREEIALEPQFAAGYFNLASALEKEHRNGEALVTYETYLRRCANHPDGQLTAAPEAFKAVQRLRDLLNKRTSQLHSAF